jgi:hypothetical protein
MFKHNYLQITVVDKIIVSYGSTEIARLSTMSEFKTHPAIMKLCIDEEYDLDYEYAFNLKEYTMLTSLPTHAFIAYKAVNEVKRNHFQSPMKIDNQLVGKTYTVDETYTESSPVCFGTQALANEFSNLHYLQGYNTIIRCIVYETATTQPTFPLLPNTILATKFKVLGAVD